ncbi:hypothetical protein [Kitasatospora terrestris]
MDGQADAREVVDRFFADREALARTGGFGTGDAREVHARRERFARSGRLEEGDEELLRLWAANRAMSAFNNLPSRTGGTAAGGAIDRALDTYRLIERWLDARPPPEDCAPRAEDS